MTNDSINSNSLIIDLDPGPIYQSYTVSYFFIGFAITIASSILNAFGINLQKLDLNRSKKDPSQKRRKDCLRPIWLIGLSLYILSQVLGSTLALQYMRSEYVAPLGSTSLIFNFIFARVLLGTQITLRDAFGTLVVILGVIGVIGFGNIRQAGIDQEANMSLSTLKTLWARPQWIFYLILLEIFTFLVIWIATIGFELITEKNEQDQRRSAEEEDDDDEIERVLRRGGGRSRSNLSSTNPLIKIFHPIFNIYQSSRSTLKSTIEHWSISKSDETSFKLDGLFWASGAGLLAGQTLVFAKSYVKLVTNGLSHDGRGQLIDLAHPLSILILTFLILTAIFQVWCLNRGLKVYDSTLIVPVLFAIYTASGFINSLIYLDELPIYRTWVLFMIWISIAILIFGVFLLSAKRSPSKSTPNTSYSNHESGQTHHQRSKDVMEHHPNESFITLSSIKSGPFKPKRVDGDDSNPFEEYEVKPQEEEEEEEEDDDDDDLPTQPHLSPYLKPDPRTQMP
ncbi:hypothetical protein CROQUDRAFT_72399 [Cronartium quercuum f. sp. fusiforme G11]|uniref:Magnesium transporter n=1 Tax=Cronartium quercuum f. sp. fusiforme G11 TaxID=708437 RepID=A0A9P6NWP5_9BASI|nr:hypothetical protein CROQUDRAFT_72399 [Cronartium quercuum f. sp. fusiforme G11]